MTTLNKSVSKSVEKLTELAHQRDQILESLSKVEQQMASLIQGSSVASSVPTQEKEGIDEISGLRKTGKKIITTLSKAGEKGLTVQELASKTGMKAANLYAWFHVQAEKISGLHKQDHHYVLKTN